MNDPISAQALREKAACLVLRICQKGYGRRFRGMAVFGSVARGTASSESDLDFLLCADPLPDSRFQRVKEFDRLVQWPFLKIWEKKGYESIDLSPLFRTPQELQIPTPVLFDATLHHWILADSDDILAHSLKRLKQRLCKAGARRIERGTLGWWDLAPHLQPCQTYKL